MATSRTGVVYFGTPGYAVPALRALAASDVFEIRLVVTQPDRPAGRGHTLQESAVKANARDLGLPVYQPGSLRNAESRQPLVEAGADLFVVAAYGLIFGEKTLGIPTLGAVNFHASILPKYRGASPISAAILAGDEETGVTLMAMERGLDSGPMLSRRAISVRLDDTTATLTDRLGELAGAMASSDLSDFLNGKLTPEPQPDHGASLVRPLRKSDGWIDWTSSAGAIERHVRAMWPWPRAWTTLDGDAIQIHRATVVSETAEPDPGKVLDGTGRVAAGRGSVRLDIVQRPGGKPVPGSTLGVGFTLGRTGEPGSRTPLIRATDAASGVG